MGRKNNKAMDKGTVVPSTSAYDTRPPTSGQESYEKMLAENDQLGIAEEYDL